MRAGALAVTALVACGDPQALEPPLYACTDPARGPEMRQFVDVRDSGLEFAYSATDFKAGGLAVADLDGDGRPDIVATSRIGGVATYRNLGAMTFAPFPDSGLDPTLAINAVAVADLDNDGDLDLVLAGEGFAYIGTNGGDGRFSTTRLDDSGTTEQVLPVDLDGDGRLDLYFSNYDQRTDESLNRLYMNRSTGFVASSIGIGRTWTTTAFDFDRDGDQDLYVANDTLAADFGRPVPMTEPTLPSDLFYRNDGVGPDGMPQLVDIAEELGLETPRSSMGGVLGDYDNNGTLDLFVPNLGASKVFVREGDAYVDRAPALGIAGILRVNPHCPSDATTEACLLLSWSGAFADFDLDGYDELLVINGETSPGDVPPAVLYTRGSADVFHEVSPGIGCLDARGLVATDLDGDGDQDVVISQNDGPIAVFETIGRPAPTAWLRVALRGATSNRSGVGAVVTAHLASGRTLIRAVGEGGVINSAGPFEAVFGLGRDSVDRLEVAWPSGRHTDLATPGTGSIVVDEP